jgi:hypothetical protein
MSGSGSVSEWQKLFAIGAKLPGRFRDCAAARPMAGNGWEVECPLLHSVGRMVVVANRNDCRVVIAQATALYNEIAYWVESDKF